MEEEKSKYRKVKRFLFKPMSENGTSGFIQYSGLGIQLAVTIIVFLFAGIWLDKKFETKFIFTLVFTFLGFIGVIYKLISLVKELDAKKKSPPPDK